MQKKEIAEVQTKSKVDKEPKKILPLKKKIETSSSEDTSSDSEEEEMKPAILSKKLPATAIKNGATVVSKNKDDSSDEHSDNSSDEEKGNGKKNVAAQKALLTLNNGVTQESSSESSESYSDDEDDSAKVSTARSVPVSIKRAVLTTTRKKKDASSDSSENYSDSDDEMGKQKGVSAIWESSDVMIFCDLCIKEIELGNRLTAHFSKDGWNNLVVKFHERTEKTYDKFQLKNKWDHLKKEWKLWHELKRGETGLGWNSARKTIDASDEWWDGRIKVVPNAKKFRYGGIHPELEEKMNVMFRTMVATGDYACTPHSRSVTRDSIDDMVMYEDDNDVVEVSGNARSIDPTASSQATKRQKKRKKKASHSAIEELVESSKVIARCLMEPPKSTCLFTISQTVEELERHPEICEDYELYDFATMFMMDKHHREIFMCIREDRKVKWLRNRYMARSQ